jgi:hypothetical protein
VAAAVLHRATTIRAPVAVAIFCAVCISPAPGRDATTSLRRGTTSEPEATYLHARDALPERLGMAFAQIAADVKDLEQNRFLHWKAQDLYKLSPRGIRVTGNRSELDLEFPES